MKANVLFFDNCVGQAEPWTEEIYFYDYHANVHHTLKRAPMTRAHLNEFMESYALSRLTH